MTSKMKQYGPDLLKNLLAPLIKQWGREEILRIISILDLESEHHLEHRKFTVGRSARTEINRRQANRPNAVIIAEKINMPEEKKALILNIAAQFERKSFLPTISDVRNFLEMRGQDARGIKQRAETFRKIIKILVDMSDEGLEKIIRSRRNSGPSQLGPLSDAIKAASASLRPRDTVLTTTEQDVWKDSSDASPKLLKIESRDPRNS